MEEPAVEAPGHPAVVRIRAANPGPMTLTGTNTYVVGSSPAWVIDPGPADRGHVELVRHVTETRGGIAGVLLTHSHSDHNAGVAMLGAPVVVGNEDGFDDLAAMLATEPVALPPAISMRPELGGIRPAIIRSTVDLPQPDGPSRETKSPCPTTRSTPRTASVPFA